MSRRKSLRSNLTSVFKDYCKNSSLHGFYYFNNSNNYAMHIIWSLIILSSFTLCVSLGLRIFQKFVDDPILTVVESTHYSAVEIPFPAVTICDPSKVYGPHATNVTEILKRRGYNAVEIDEFYNSITAVENTSYSPSLTLKKMHMMLEELEYSLEVLLDQIKKPCEVLIRECVWRSKSYNCSQMFRDVFTFSGFCCQFDMEYFKRNADPSTTFQSGVQASEGLEVVVNGQKYHPNGTVDNGYVMLYVFDYHDSITLLDSSVTITPSGYFDVKVGAWAISATEYVKALDVRSRKCILDTDSSYDAGFYHGCVMQSIMKRVVDACRCLPLEYNDKELQIRGYTPCKWERLPCVYITLKKVLGDMRTIITESECYQRCDHVQYETEVKYIKQLRSYLTKNATYSKIAVHLAKNTCMKYRREVIYTWDQMLANLGGIFGLCLGGSIISIIELVWFLLNVLSTIMTYLRKEKVSQEGKKFQNNLILNETALTRNNAAVRIKFY